MKTSNEYRAEGFRNWWRFAKESSLIALMQVIGYFVYVSATIIVDKYFPGNGTEDLMWKFGKTLVLLGTIGLLSYYVPVWFLSVRRGKKLVDTDISTNYGRVLMVCAAIMVPTLVSDIWNILVSLGAEDTLGNRVSFVYLALIGLIVFWPFAVAITLPFRAYDHPKTLVNYLIRTNIKMMDGYKWNLFSANFKIWIWPIVVLALTAFICLVASLVPINEALKVRNMTFEMFLNEDYVRQPVWRYVWAKHSMVYIVSAIIMILELVACVFVVNPACHFANICFYEDMLKERGGDLVDDEVRQEESVIPNNPCI